MMDFGGIYLNNDVLEISMYDFFVDRDQDPLMTILFNQYMNHDCTCKMQITPRHYLMYVDCEVIISHVETIYTMAPLLCFTSWTL